MYVCMYVYTYYNTTSHLTAAGCSRQAAVLLPIAPRSSAHKQ